jgi:hypothetical protein
MTQVKYTIRGFELLDINPEFVSDLERVTSELFNAGVSFPDFNAYEESADFMHSVTKEGSCNPKSPWAKARFRYDGDARIDSLQGILIKPSENEKVYVKLADNIPQIAANSMIFRYNSSLLWKLNEKFVRGKSVERMIIDRGKEQDSVSLTLGDGTEMTFLYRQGTFIGFEIDDSTGQGIKSTHYILGDVDPSVYVPGFAESFAERKDVIFNEGLRGEVKPLLAGSNVSYRKPREEQVELIEAQKGDRYIVVFEANTPEKAQRVHSDFKRAFEGKHTTDTQIPLNVNDLARHLGPKISVNEFPIFAVDLTRDKKPESRFYGLTLTTQSTGSFKTQNDLRDFLRGSIIGMKSDSEADKMELI